MEFKGIGIDTFDAVLLKKGERQKPEKIYIDYGTLPESSEDLYEDTGTYLPYERVVEILIKDPDEEDYVNQWLDGSGNLSLEESGYYKAKVLTVETVTESFSMGWKRKIIAFRVQPFLFYFSGDTMVTLTSGQTVVNPGIETYPYIKITGTGPVTLNIASLNKKKMAYTV